MLTVALVYRKNGPWFENVVYIRAFSEINFQIRGPEIKIHFEKIYSLHPWRKSSALTVWIGDFAHQNYQIFRVEFIWHFLSWTFVCNPPSDEKPVSDLIFFRFLDNYEDSELTMH